MTTIEEVMPLITSDNTALDNTRHLPRAGGFSLTYLGIELRRILRNTSFLIFTIGMPVAMYLVFGSTFAQGTDQAGSGNVHFYVMVSMALYGAISSTTSVSGNAALEIMQGWGRQIGLTPLRSASYVAMKTALALIISFLAVSAVFLAGVLTGAGADSWRTWVVSFLICWLGSATFALFGLAVAQLGRSESAVSIANGALVLLSFFGNLFVPLSGTMLSIARFTPLYGLAALARWPQLQGYTVGTASDAYGPRDSMGFLIANVVIWMAIFALLAAFATRRSRQRQ